MTVGMKSLSELAALPVPELRARFLLRSAPVPRGLLEVLEADPRAGARELARRIRSCRTGNRAEGQRLRYLLRYETELWKQGVELIAGVDEVGMACIAGPVMAGAVILKRGYKLRGLNDSKQVPEPAERRRLAERIKADALAWAIGRAEVEEIDSLNIYHAGLLAMARAVGALGTAPQFVLVDGRRIPGCRLPQRKVVHGDELSACIAAASVVAKTVRDAWMAEQDTQYPGYGFASHKGYPTPEHCRALERLGPTALHRRSFARVRQWEDRE
jgi:ribonuclease HII